MLSIEELRAKKPPPSPILRHQGEIEGLSYSPRTPTTTPTEKEASPPTVFLSKKQDENLQEGYSCTLAEPLQKNLVINCLACKKILRDPCNVTCCGECFCQTCLENVMKKNQPCPHCSSIDFDGYSNATLGRRVKDLLVHCTYEEDGCRWTGKLEKLKSHLNSEQDNETCCRFITVQCSFCGQAVKRHQLMRHKKEICIKRPFSCQYCGKYTSTFNDVIDNHRPVCKYYPIRCTNNCGELIIQMDMKNHIENDCVLTKIKCEFQEVGCMVKVSRRELPDHMTNSSSYHMVLMLRRLKEVTGKMTDLEMQTKREIDDLKRENTLLKAKIEQDKDKSYKVPIVVIPASSDVSTPLTDQKMNLNSPENLLLIAEFTMSNYFELKRENKQWISPPFYSQQGGYRMCLQVLANGHGNTKGKFISVYIYMMRGEFDDQLPWPFRGDVVIRLVNQNTDSLHHQKTIKFTENTPDVCAGRVLDSEMSSDARGIPDYIHLSELLSKFLKNDSLVFRILRFREKSAY